MTSKSNKMSVRKAKTLISRTSAQSNQSLLCAQWGHTDRSRLDSWGQQILWSDWSDAYADLSFCDVRDIIVFFMLWLIQRATLVLTIFQAPHFLTKMLESNIHYDNLLIDILSVWWHRKNIGITHANHSATPKAILTKKHVQPERLYFLFVFCARYSPWWSLWRKTPKTIILFI